jgi:hypothetical protein
MDQDKRIRLNLNSDLNTANQVPCGSIFTVMISRASYIIGCQLCSDDIIVTAPHELPLRSRELPPPRAVIHISNNRFRSIAFLNYNHGCMLLDFDELCGASADVARRSFTHTRTPQPPGSPCRAQRSFRFRRGFRLCFLKRLVPRPVRRFPLYHSPCTIQTNC